MDLEKAKETIALHQRRTELYELRDSLWDNFVDEVGITIIERPDTHLEINGVEIDCDRTAWKAILATVDAEIKKAEERIKNL